MADAWNLGWKLPSLLRGTSPAELLHTYSAERQQVVGQLIEFDRRFARLFAHPPAEDTAFGARLAWFPVPS